MTYSPLDIEDVQKESAQIGYSYLMGRRTPDEIDTATSGTGNVDVANHAHVLTPGGNGDFARLEGMGWTLGDYQINTASNYYGLRIGWGLNFGISYPPTDDYYIGMFNADDPVSGADGVVIDFANDQYVHRGNTTPLGFTPDVGNGQYTEFLSNGAKTKVTTYDSGNVRESVTLDDEIRLGERIVQTNGNGGGDHGIAIGLVQQFVRFDKAADI